MLRNKLLSKVPAFEKVDTAIKLTLVIISTYKHFRAEFDKVFGEGQPAPSPTQIIEAAVS